MLNLSAHLRDLRQDGFTSFRLDPMPELAGIQNGLFDLAGRLAGRNLRTLDSLHECISPEALNGIRTEAIQYINRDSLFRAALLERARPLLTASLGADLAAQKYINLVVSIPEDATSQIPLHADTWVGHSAFELNLWVPLTKVARTQSMFILPLPAWKARRHEWDGKTGTIQEFLEKWKSDFRFVELNPGEALLFWHALPHGNVVNRENLTRWSLTMRFKNLFAPYGEKRLGDYFLPWQYGVVTELALQDGKLWD